MIYPNKFSIILPNSTLIIYMLFMNKPFTIPLLLLSSQAYLQ